MFGGGDDTTATSRRPQVMCRKSSQSYLFTVRKQGSHGYLNRRVDETARHLRG